MFRLHFSVLMFGITGLFGKFVTLSSTMITFGRCFFAVIFLFFCIVAMKENFFFKSKKDFLTVLFTGVIIGLVWFFFFQSIKVSTVSVGLITYATVAIFTTFIEPLYFRKKIRRTDIILAFVAFIGVCLVVPDFNLSDNITQGVILGLLAAFFSSIFCVMTKKLITKYSSVKLTFYQYGTVAVLGLPFFAVQHPSVDAKNLMLIIILGVIFTGFANTLFISSFKKVTATKAMIILTLEPIYGVILAIILLGEKPTMNTLIGGVIIFLSAFYATIEGQLVAKLRTK
ncbi:MAG TPA: EamA family transporter [Lentisphaeria bacterium]|nr:MAG: hypothetical protein A2X47_13165 [Lentisphaerae bacterium GWF2_38_69]HBM15998.1 EamA family transporter [Lentisphaeria bacterium]